MSVSLLLSPFSPFSAEITENVIHRKCIGNSKSFEYFPWQKKDLLLDARAITNIKVVPKRTYVRISFADPRYYTEGRIFLARMVVRHGSIHCPFYTKTRALHYHWAL